MYVGRFGDVYWLIDLRVKQGRDPIRGHVNEDHHADEQASRKHQKNDVPFSLAAAHTGDHSKFLNALMLENEGLADTF